VPELNGPALIGVFLVAAIATWVAGVNLSKATDALDQRLQLGAALGGVILLAVAGSLPELAITVSAALQGSLDLAAGNLIGGIAAQTLVLVLCDRAVRGDRPLSFLVGSLKPVIEGLLVVAVVGVMLLGTMLPATTAIGPFSPASIGILVAWIVGIAVLARLRKGEPWGPLSMPGARPGRHHRRERHPTAPTPFDGRSTIAIAGIFGVACLVTLIAGVALERSGNGMADLAGINGVVFGATFLAAATALPEISSGLAAVRLGDNELAVADIFGGNAFQLCLFIVADALAGRPVLPEAGVSNAWLGALGIVMTVVVATAVIVRTQRRYAGLGIDSVVNIGVYALGIIGLLIVTR
jgi:cation:H+ antiporter